MGQVIYYKGEQSLLQSGAGITKCGNLNNKEGEYTFVILEWMETHVYW